MKRFLYVLSAVMTIMFLTISDGVAAAESDRGQGQLIIAQVKQLTPTPVQTTSQNLTKALQVIMAALTYSDVINAFKTITMSAAEIEQFKLAIAKEPYASKIAQLKQQKTVALSQTGKTLGIDINPYPPTKSSAGSNGFIPTGNRSWTTFGVCENPGYGVYEQLVVKGPKGLKYY